MNDVGMKGMNIVLGVLFSCALFLFGTRRVV